MSKLVCVPNSIKIGWLLAEIQGWSGLCSLCMQKWGKTLLWGVKPPTLGEREALKTFRHWCTRQILSFDVFFVEIGDGRFLVKFSHFLLIKVPPKIAVYEEPLSPSGSFRGFFILNFCNSSNDVIWAFCDDLATGLH
jgi:hypothetical protein